MKRNDNPVMSIDDFDLLKLLGTGGYGEVFLVRKKTQKDAGTLYAMKVINKYKIVGNAKLIDHTITERHILEAVKGQQFFVQMHYAFHTNDKLHLVLGKFEFY